ncbi:hypothetical protein BGW80DRAFT_1335685 [Lactifluus volemus]|nr:hypothetical protein BGW80DRAFT_1335685 [Lactifluus volemus]
METRKKKGTGPQRERHEKRLMPARRRRGNNEAEKMIGREKGYQNHLGKKKGKKETLREWNVRHRDGERGEHIEVLYFFQGFGLRRTTRFSTTRNTTAHIPRLPTRNTYGERSDRIVTVVEPKSTRRFSALVSSSSCCSLVGVTSTADSGGGGGGDTESSELVA